MIATFINEQGEAVTHNIGESLNLQDALNATINSRFATSVIVIHVGKNKAETVENTEKEVLGHVGRHSVDELFSKYHNMDVVAKAINDGTFHEMEHTDNIGTARAIAIDHLYDNLNYYNRIKDAKLAHGGMIKRTTANLTGIDSITSEDI
jgi:hypothetical protein